MPALIPLPVPVLSTLVAPGVSVDTVRATGLTLIRGGAHNGKLFGPATDADEQHARAAELARAAASVDQDAYREGVLKRMMGWPRYRRRRRLRR
jgi:hypothetical protein